MTYESGQVRAIFPHITKDIGVFILGGPADGDEAQLFHRQFPNVLIFGFEPNRGFFEHQISVGFPGELRSEALWDHAGTHDFYLLGEGEGRSSRLVIEGEQAPAYPVKTVTIDDVLAGPNLPSKVALWIDIERSELTALHGAETSLRERRIEVVYLEAFSDNVQPIIDYLAPFGLKEVARVNCHEMINDAGTHRYNRFDIIFKLQ